MVGSIVCTLGPSGTCSEHVLKQHLSRFPTPTEVRLCASYEEAAFQVGKGEADFVLVAAAFPSLNDLLFSPIYRLRIVDTFVEETCELVVAVNGDGDTLPRTIACMVAPSPALRAAYPDAEIVPARSNADAAHVAAAGDADAALTTTLAAASLHLRPILSIGSRPMAWVVLARDRGGSAARLRAETGAPVCGPNTALGSEPMSSYTLDTSAAIMVEMFPGFWRQTLVYDHALMLCLFTWRAGATLPSHVHPHEQAGYVIRGAVELTIAGDVVVTRTGCSYIVPSGSVHSAKALEDALVVDAFAPARAEYVVTHNAAGNY